MITLILGASGNVAQQFITAFEQQGDPSRTLALFVRSARRLPRDQRERYQVFEGDMHDAASLIDAVSIADEIVSFVGSSPMPIYAKALLDALEQANKSITRILWLGAGGMNHETIGREGEFWRSMPGYFNQQKEAGDMLMASSYDATIISPVMFHGGPAAKPIITDSHTQTPAQTVSRQTIALVYLEALLQNKWRNQMITVGDRQ